jgi:hypothetical protein
LLSTALGAKIEDLTRRCGARHQIWRVEPAATGPFEIRYEGAAGIGCNRSNRVSDWAKAEPVEAERRCGFSRIPSVLCTHGSFKNASRAPHIINKLSLWQKLWRGRQNCKQNITDPFILARHCERLAAPQTRP